MKRRDFFGFLGKAAVAAPIAVKALAEAKPLPKVLTPEQLDAVLPPLQASTVSIVEDRYVSLACMVSVSPGYWTK